MIVSIADKLVSANAALGCFAQGTTIIIKPKIGVAVSWERRGTLVTKRWMTRGQDFYPVWSKNWGYGGTKTTALSQLVRWVQHKPVVPISTWEYWASAKCHIAGSRGDELVELLDGAGYPRRAACVLCKRLLDVGGMDWWRLDGRSGPCCGWTTGCRQKPSPDEVSGVRWQKPSPDEVSGRPIPDNVADALPYACSC